MRKQSSANIKGKAPYAADFNAVQNHADQYPAGRKKLYCACFIFFFYIYGYRCTEIIF